jgi:hypothetical protein
MWIGQESFAAFETSCPARGIGPWRRSTPGVAEIHPDQYIGSVRRGRCRATSCWRWAYRPRSPSLGAPSFSRWVGVGRRGAVPWKCSFEEGLAKASGSFGRAYKLRTNSLGSGDFKCRSLLPKPRCIPPQPGAIRLQTWLSRHTPRPVRRKGFSSRDRDPLTRNPTQARPLMHLACSEHPHPCGKSGGHAAARHRSGSGPLRYRSILLGHADGVAPVAQHIRQTPCDPWTF